MSTAASLLDPCPDWIVNKNLDTPAIVQHSNGGGIHILTCLAVHMEILIIIAFSYTRLPYSPNFSLNQGAILYLQINGRSDSFVELFWEFTP